MTMDKKAANQLNGASLAYVGDAVTEVYVRSYILSCGVTDTGRYNELAQMFVTAHAQSKAYSRIEPFLTDGERDVLKRGRNAKLTHRPRNQTQTDYRRATGFEALIGWLYLTGEGKRAEELFKMAYIDIIEGIANKTL